MRGIVHGVLLVALTAGIFGVLPRLGGLTRDAAGLRHARPAGDRGEGERHRQRMPDR